MQDMFRTVGKWGEVPKMPFYVSLPKLHAAPVTLKTFMFALGLPCY